MSNDRDVAGVQPQQDANRRSFVGTLSRIAMGTGLVAGYGMLGAIAARFLYPSGGGETGWQFVIEMDRLPVGGSVRYRTPAGESVNVTRIGRGGTEQDFIALSSVCPHLGCQVHWESHNNRYFCPCHNGVFDPSGRATAGPPADAGQSLATFPLRVDNGVLMIEVPLKKLTRSERREDARRLAARRARAGHDPCLVPRAGGKNERRA